MSHRGNSRYNYEYDDDDDDEPRQLPANLDPTVAALLQKDPTQDPTMTTSSIRLVIAQMKLQQSRVRGNSDYAAKVMDDAIAEGARDRQAWTLMDDRIRKLEKHIAKTTAAAAAAAEELSNDNTNSNNEDNENQQETSNEETNAEGKEISDQNNEFGLSGNDPDVEKRVQDAMDRASTMESILIQCLKEEIDHVQVEQASLKKREEQLRGRIRSLQVALQALPPELQMMPSSNDDKIQATQTEKAFDETPDNDQDETIASSTATAIHSSSTTTSANPAETPPRTTRRQDLHRAMQDIHEQQSTLLKTQCTICHEHTATRAVIPCGHLCLCDDCTARIVTPPPPPQPPLLLDDDVPHQPQCPLCRGHLLSTLHIYTTK